MVSLCRRTGGLAPIGFPVVTTGGIVIQIQRRLIDVIPKSEADAIWRIALAIAKEIEGNVKAGEDWMCYEGIAEFGGLTAADLIEVGQGRQVIGFLLDVLAGARG
jgi:hypothetical protein